jgi:hypothetical protein
MFRLRVGRVALPRATPPSSRRTTREAHPPGFGHHPAGPVDGRAGAERDAATRGNHGQQHQAHRCRGRAAGAGHHAPGHGAPGHRHRRAADQFAVGQRQRPRQPGLQCRRRGRRGARQQRPVGRQPARPGSGSHAGAAERPAHRRPRPQRRHRRPAVHPHGRGRARRDPEGRRLGHLRHRRHRRRHQLHPAQELQRARGAGLHRHHRGRRRQHPALQAHRRLRRPGEEQLQRAGVAVAQREQGAARRPARLRQHLPARPRPVGGHARHALRHAVRDRQPLQRPQPRQRQRHRPRHRPHAARRRQPDLQRHQRARPAGRRRLRQRRRHGRLRRGAVGHARRASAAPGTPAVRPCCSSR